MIVKNKLSHATQEMTFSEIQRMQNKNINNQYYIVKKSNDNNIVKEIIFFLSVAASFYGFILIALLLF